MYGCNNYRVEISGPMEFTHVQHFGPHQSINLEKMPVRNGHGVTMMAAVMYLSYSPSPLLYPPSLLLFLLTPAFHYS